MITTRSRGQRNGLVAAAAAALTLGLVASGSANSGSVRDPAGDVAGNPPGANSAYDLVGATFGHKGKRKLVHTAALKGKAGDPIRGDPFPLLLIDVPKKQFSPGCDYFVSTSPPASAGKPWVGHVFRCSIGAAPAKVGWAKITKANAHTIKYVFARKAIGKPRKYRWALAFGGSGGILFDRLPDTGFKVHRLR
jgi:hypothetical protein